MKRVTCSGNYQITGSNTTSYIYHAVVTLGVMIIKTGISQHVGGRNNRVVFLVARNYVMHQQCLFGLETNSRLADTVSI